MKIMNAKISSNQHGPSANRINFDKVLNDSPSDSAKRSKKEQGSMEKINLDEWGRETMPELVYKFRDVVKTSDGSGAGVYPEDVVRRISDWAKKHTRREEQKMAKLKYTKQQRTDYKKNLKSHQEAKEKKQNVQLEYEDEGYSKTKQQKKNQWHEHYKLRKDEAQQQGTATKAKTEKIILKRAEEKGNQGPYDGYGKGQRGYFIPKHKQQGGNGYDYNGWQGGWHY